MIIWDDVKYNKLKDERYIDLVEIEQIILNKKYIASLKNPARSEQRVFIVLYKKYIHVVPYIIDDDKNIVLKTAYPSRKFNRIYGETEK
ncbi:MAG: hypothetical protein PF693_01400 [Spirochaetia bacterium]|jgi:uncharacterized DUF497 family protein|nr:hypothetical protein [Spirochaetia bacterium]